MFLDISQETFERVSFQNGTNVDKQRKPVDFTADILGKNVDNDHKYELRVDDPAYNMKMTLINKTKEGVMIQMALEDLGLHHIMTTVNKELPEFFRASSPNNVMNLSAVEKLTW